MVGSVYRWNEEVFEFIKFILYSKVFDFYSFFEKMDCGIFSIDQVVNNFISILNSVFMFFCSVFNFLGGLFIDIKFFSSNKLWFDDKCKEFCKVYKSFLCIFNWERFV